MKKTKQDTRTTKLELRQTTVRRLDARQLENVAGGACCASCELTCHKLQGVPDQ